MRDQINMDLMAGAAKITPAAALSTYGVAEGLSLADWAMIATILLALVQTAAVVVKNWGEWGAWLSARAVDARRVYAWVRRRG